jgi:hypothetical protein
VTEVWKDVSGFEGAYQVSNRGRVKSLERVVKSRWAKGCTYHEKMLSLKTKNRYCKVVLRLNGELKNALIHRLVAQAFIPNPKNLPEVNHIDGDTNNNAADNLEWCNASQNAHHALALGLRKSVKGDKHGKSKITEKQAREIKYSTESRKALAEKYGLTYSGIYQIQAGYRWKHI